MTLVDLSKKSLELAEMRMTSEGYKTEYVHLSATDLEQFFDETYDFVLVLGPMYHLHHLSDRSKVLHDVKRTV